MIQPGYRTGKWIGLALLTLLLAGYVHAQRPPGGTPPAEVDSLNARAARLLQAHPDTALKLGFRAVRLALQLDYLSGHTQALLLVGRSYSQLHKDKKALQYFLETHARAAERRQDPEASDALYYMAGVYFDWEEYDQALQHYLRSHGLRGKIRDTLRMAEVLDRIGGVYQVTGNLTKALRNYQQSLRYYQKMDNKPGMAAAYGNLGLVYYRREEFDRAIELHNQSLELYRELGDAGGVAAALRNTGDIHFSRGEFGKSLTSYFRALQRQQKLGDQAGIADTYNRIARSYFAQRQYTQAIHYYGKATGVAGKVGAQEPLMQAYQGLARSYAQVNDFRRAYDLQDQYLAVRDSLLSRRTSREVAQAEARHELQTRQQEVELLRKEQRIQSITLERNRQLNYLMGVLSVVLLVLGLVYVNRYFIKRRANRLLSARNQIIQAQNRDLQLINDKLRASEENLQNVVGTKDKFFTIISHDLRGPLNSLTGLLQILIRNIDGFSRDELKHFALGADRTVRNLRSLMDNLLEWSRTQRGNIGFQPEPLGLADLVQEIFNLQEIGAVNKKIAIYYDIPTGLQVHADRNMLHFVLRNLVDNAVKFTGAGGKVWVTAESTDDKAEISVCDTGIGMPPEDVAKLFRLDTYHSTSGTADETGTGLGLIICNEFVNRHGGAIAVESRPGEGTVFRFALPVHSLVGA